MRSTKLTALINGTAFTPLGVQTATLRTVFGQAGQATEDLVVLPLKQ
jgi:hypothetical protein